ncbi:MAG TPA: DUF3515 domain-containing protein [Jatrophihabitans sp.]
MLIVGLLFAGAGSNSPGPSPSASSGAVLPPVSVSAPPDTSAATVATCARVISALPLQLAGADVRRTESDPPSASIVAWGDPAIVLRCGVARPARLNPSLTQQVFAVNGVLMLPARTSGQTVFTVIDRSVYLDVSVPTSYAQPPLGPIADAVKKVLPKPVCVQDPTAPRSKLCTRRK